MFELLKHVVASLPAVGQRHVNLTDLPNHCLPFAVSDAAIFINLILNSFDAMPGGGSLCITARELENGVEFTFEDSGPGIPEDRRNNIFEPFFSTKEGGTGLGLTVSYNIVTAHGGTLDIVDGQDSGACFRLFLPTGDKQ
jgi:signal transduction histidine kinase